MKSKSSGLRARRSLSFEERPYAGKTFYIDVKSASAKSKISQRITKLGGQIENFLSKDLSLLITDKNSTRQPREDCSQKQSVKNVPLSRGQALLLKASVNQNCDSSNNNNGILQSAAKLGVQTETPAGFLRDSSKLLEKFKPETPAGKLETSMSGMSPITWDSEKENVLVIKVEDEEGLYRPLFKQFDSFPQISYNETGSPFDVGVVLTKVKESNNQSKRKSVGGALRGGYCESCDHWYKCSLREHLNSEKHKEFISVAENFRSLNHVSSSLPNLKKFVGKYGLKGNDDSPNSQNLTCVLNKCDSDQKDLIHSRLSPWSEENRNYKELGCLSGHVDRFSDIQKVMCNTVSKTEPILERKINHDLIIPNTRPANVAEESLSLRYQQCDAKLPNANCQKNSGWTGQASKTDDFNSEISRRSNKESFSQKSGRKFSVDDVIKSVTENDDYFSYGNIIEDPFSKTSHVITEHQTSGGTSSVRSKLSLPGSNSRVVNPTAEDSYKENMSVINPTVKCDQNAKENALTFQNIPMMHFSSSSFGDNGVSNVISLLNSQHSRKSCDREGLSNGSLLRENKSVVEGSCSGNSSWSFERFSEVTGSGENAFVNNYNNQEQLHVANGNTLEQLIDDVCDNEMAMPVLEAEGDSRDRGFDLDLMPVLNSYNSEEMDTFCESLVKAKVDNQNAAISVSLPEYSNITEESMQDKAQLDASPVVGKNEQTNNEIPFFNLRNSILKDDVKLETPDKMDNLKSRIYEKQANSGSTIRNWLLPNADSGSVRSVNSPGNLNATLVNTSCNVVETSLVDNDKDIEKVTDDKASLNDITETADSSKVADWIQRQDFVKAESCNENSRQGLEENFVDLEPQYSANARKIENNENEDFCFKDLKSCSEKKYGSEKHDLEDRSNAWSESGTSISDCTLDNFRIKSESEKGGPGTEKDLSKETVIEKATDILKLDEMSQHSNISAKTGLSSLITSKGIKITGLSSLSSHFFNAVEGDVFTETESSTLAYGDSRKNSESSFAVNVNKIVPNANCTPNVACAEQNFSKGINQGPQQIIKTPIDSNHSNVIVNNYNENCLKTNVEENSVASHEKTKPKGQRSRSSVKKGSETKARKPRATKTTRSKKQLQSHNLLNQVLTSNLYSPISSVTGNSPGQSIYTEQMYCQMSPNPHNLGQGYATSPVSTNHQQGFGHYQQPQFGMQGFQNNTHDHNPYSQNHSEVKMMDLLLSPGSQGSTLYPQGNFQQNLDHQQQNMFYQNPQSFVSQQSNVSLNGGCMSKILTNQNINNQFGSLPFSGLIQNQNNFQSNKENSHHFLSSNSNFFMHNWNNGSSVKPQSQQAHQVPGNGWNDSASPSYMSHDQSISNGSLKTIEMSHIADSIGQYENNFNFKIADTQNLKKSLNASKKPRQQKENKEVTPSYNQNISASTNETHLSSSNSVCDVRTESRNSTKQSASHVNNSQHLSDNKYTGNPSQQASSNQTNYAHQNHYTQAHYYNSNQNSQQVPQVTGYHGNSPGCYGSVQQGSTDRQVNMYNTVQTGDTKITIRRLSASNPAPVDKQPKHDLMQYWNVRKAGDCRLVFSANVVNGKRKAEEETPTKIYMSHASSEQYVQPLPKKRKCLVY